MARGRMITNLICKDKKVHALSDDTARLLFTWLITVADCEGRTFGDPSIVKATIFPRRNDITSERVDGYLNEMFMLGLIVRYIVDDEQYIFFPSFEKNQIGLRKDREAKSEIPAPPLRSKSGVSPDEIPVKLIEVKTIENKEIETNTAVVVNIFKLYENTVGAVTAMMADELRQAEKDYPAEWMPEAFLLAEKANVRKWNYIKAILDRWKTEGRGRLTDKNKVKDFEPLLEQ